MLGRGTEIERELLDLRRGDRLIAHRACRDPRGDVGGNPEAERAAKLDHRRRRLTSLGDIGHMRPRAAVTFGELEQGRGLAQGPRHRDHRAFARRQVEQGLDSVDDFVPRGFDPDRALAPEQRHRPGFVSEARGVGLDALSQHDELLGIAKPAQQFDGQRAAARLVGAVEQIEADCRVGLGQRAGQASLVGFHGATLPWRAR